MNRVFCCIVGLVLAHGALAQGAGAGIDLRLSRDTDGFEASRMRALALARYENPWRHDGVAAQEVRYSEPGFRAHGRGVLFLHRDQRRDTLAGVELEAGAMQVLGRTRVVGEATWRWAPRLDAPSYELVAAADWVETRRALERGIAYRLAGAGVEVPLDARFSATAFAAHQAFTDGNSRMHLRARFITLLSEEHGVTAQLRYRGFDSRHEDVGGAYFNPGRYDRLLAVAALRQRRGGWTWRAEAGAGRERVDGRGRPAAVAELHAEGPVAGETRLLLRAGYTRSAGSIADDPDYAWRYAGLTFVIPLE